MNTFARCIILGVMLLLPMECSSPVAGSGSQTSNGIKVGVQYKSIVVNAQPGTLIDLMSNNYSPVLNEGYRNSRVIEQDSSFLFESLNPDSSYRLLAFSSDSLIGINIPELKPLHNQQSYIHYYPLLPTTVIEGKISDTSKVSDLCLVSVSIGKTPIIANIKGSYQFTIIHVPQGYYTLEVVMASKVESWGDKIENSFLFNTDRDTTHISFDILK